MLKYAIRRLGGNAFEYALLAIECVKPPFARNEGTEKVLGYSVIIQ